MAAAAQAQPVAMPGARSGGYSPVRRRSFTYDPFAELLPRKHVCKVVFAVFRFTGVALQQIYISR